MIHQVVLSTGSNIEPRSEYLSDAILSITKEIGSVKSQSLVYESQPWGNKDQNDFLNQILIVESEYDPYQILEKIQKIELDLNRIKKEHWGARTIDIDIIYIDDLIMIEEKLQIPHLRLDERLFVLIPMCEILPDFVHPVFEVNQLELLKICKDPLSVTLWKA